MVSTRSRANSTNSLSSQRSTASSRARRAETRKGAAKPFEKETKATVRKKSYILEDSESPSFVESDPIDDKTLEDSKTEKGKFKPSDFKIDERVLVECEKEKKFVPGTVSIVRVRKLKIHVDGRPKSKAIWVSDSDSIRRLSELPTVTEEVDEEKENKSEKKKTKTTKRKSIISKSQNLSSTKPAQKKKQEILSNLKKNKETKNLQAESKTTVQKASNNETKGASKTNNKLADAELLLQQIKSESMNVNDNVLDPNSDSSSDDENEHVQIIKKKPNFKLSAILKPKSEGKSIEKTDENALMWSQALKPESAKRKRSVKRFIPTKLDIAKDDKHDEDRGQKQIREKEKQRQVQRDWFEMKTPQMTQELKDDLRALQLRHYMDPKRFYKANDSKTIPKTFQIGTVIAGAADDRFSRLTRKERKSRFVDEVLADKKITSYAKRVFKDIEKSNEAGGRGDYRKRQKKRMSKNKKLR
eukprot:CAMPEP_0204825538 /NCGR_PEP_ID=MMETSP1346-20131115/3400_1 /ASSEMBLY_ACC=CAM_ASM_000771 /TAXON_ID=215587 /ORGANISM="Aplanochytrium stocchinoi, Strain GSBS06" /LENGTH=471 /DNA_ID=CAMNT_0051953201 /DNA_START=137 /DNA_END=1552 /DNA_ORIENTATION=-